MQPYQIGTAQKLESALKAANSWTFARLGEELETLSSEQDDDSVAHMFSYYVSYYVSCSYAPLLLMTT
jgi:hypothetical protein